MSTYEDVYKKIQDDKKDRPIIKHYYLDNTQPLSYAYIYNLANNKDASIASGDAIKFSNNGLLNNIEHIGGTENILIKQSGKYKIFYSVNLDSKVTISIALTVNGLIEPATKIGNGLFFGEVILDFKTNDIVSLVNHSDQTINLVLEPNISAQLSIIQIS